MRGYSDPINHAFAFAAKHHDQQVRKGTRPPYLTAAPNVAVILTRYGQSERQVVAGILHDVAEDYVRDAFTPEMLEARIADKFGSDVLELLLSVVERRYDDEGIELSQDERREDLLARLADADDAARWVMAADDLHAAGSLLAELHRTDFPEALWSRSSTGRDAVPRHRRLCTRLRELAFDAPIMYELEAVVAELETLAREPR